MGPVALLKQKLTDVDMTEEAMDIMLKLSDAAPLHVRQ